MTKPTLTIVAVTSGILFFYIFIEYQNHEIRRI